MKRSSNRLGDWGEAIAARHLERAGWTVLDRKFRVGRSEIDLVAYRGEVVAFVEVKTRRSGSAGHPLEAIDPRKQAQIAAVASGWVDTHGEDRFTYRFDAIAVMRGAGGEVVVEHVEDAWRM